MAEVKKPVDLDGLGALVGKIKADYAKKTDVADEVANQIGTAGSVTYATSEEILALFDDDESGS